MRILDGEVVEAKLFLHLAQQRLVGLVQADPHEVARIPATENVAHVREVHVADALSLGVLRAIHQPGASAVAA
jgi:hypothetical protein